MDGSGIDLVVIPIVALISLIAFLVPIYRANAHPRWKHTSATSDFDVRVTVSADSAADGLPDGGEAAPMQRPFQPPTSILRQRTPEPPLIRHASQSK